MQEANEEVFRAQEELAAAQAAREAGAAREAVLAQQAAAAREELEAAVAARDALLSAAEAQAQHTAAQLAEAQLDVVRDGTEVGGGQIVTLPRCCQVAATQFLRRRPARAHEPARRDAPPPPPPPRQDGAEADRGALQVALCTAQASLAAAEAALAERDTELDRLAVLEGEAKAARMRAAAELQTAVA